MPTSPSWAAQTTRVASCDAVGLQFIIQNLLNIRRRLSETKDPQVLLQSFVETLLLRESDVRGEFKERVDYKMDIANSHSALLMRCLLQKFSESFFETAMSHWQNGLAERVRDRLQLDLRDLELSVGHEQVKFVSLQEEVGSPETGEGEQKKKESGKKSGLRARVVVTPFLFERYLPDSMMRSLEKKWRKL